MILISLVLGFVACMVSAGVTVWLILRKGGLTDHMFELKSVQVKSMEARLAQILLRLNEVEQKVEVIDIKWGELEASTSRRIASFESRYGKEFRKEQKERERVEALEAVSRAAQSQQIT